MDLIKLVPDYLDYCQYQKNLSSDTLKAYRIALAQFSVYWAGTDGALTRGNLTSYIVLLQKRYQPRTARRKTASLKAFFGWLTYMELLENDPFQKLRVKFNEPKILPARSPFTCSQTSYPKSIRPFRRGNGWRCGTRRCWNYFLPLGCGSQSSARCPRKPLIWRLAVS